MNDVLAAIIGFGIIALIISGLLGLIVLGVNNLERAQCKQRANAMGMDWDFGFIKGCMIWTSKGWVPINNYRYFEE